jgi:hypothetical protein
MTRNAIDENGEVILQDMISSDAKTFVLDILRFNLPANSSGKLFVPGNVMYTSKKVCVNLDLPLICRTFVVRFGSKICHCIIISW